MKMLEVKNLTVTADTDSGYAHIVCGLSFCVDGGKTLAIVGESGSGKTMTARAIFGILPVNCKASGSVLLDGEEMLALPERRLNRIRGTKAVMAPQSGAEYLNPALTVRTQIYESLAKCGVPRSRREREAYRKMYLTGIEAPNELIDKYPFELSGGQAQKVTLAAASSPSALLVVADEPTKGIDAESAETFIGSLSSAFLQAARVIITHDISIAAKADDILVMYGGTIAEYGSAAEILSRPRHPYTENLIRALPENGFCSDVILRERVHGGCVYYDRCPKADELCGECEPPAITDGSGYARCRHA